MADSEILLADGQHRPIRLATDETAGRHTLKTTGGGSSGASAPTAFSRIPSSAASVNGTVAKASAGTLHQVTAYNTGAALRWLKIYNKASAPGAADVPVLSIALPPGTGFALDFRGLAFATGIAYQLVTGSADNDTGAVAAAEIVGVNLGYA